MIVRCPNCGTEFGFDDKQIGDGVTVKCSVCKHVFKVELPSARAQDPGWQIRTPDGMTFTAADVETLREWIAEGRLTTEDQLSRTGRNWVRLGDMPEFSSSFAAFEGVTPVVRPAEPPPPPPRRVSAPPAPSAPPPSSRPAVQPESARVTAPPPAPAPAPAPAPIAARLEAGAGPQSHRPTLSPPRSSPAQRAAPVASRDDAELLESNDDADDDLDEAPTRVRARASGSGARLAREHEYDEDDEDEDDDGLDDFAPPKRSGISPGFIAFLGIIAAVAVMFGVPQFRERLLNLGRSDEVAPSVDRPEIAAAQQALRSLGTAPLAKAEADLQRAVDARSADAPTQAALELALAELLTNRALAYEIAAALDPAQRDDFRHRAAEDQEDGERIVDGIQGSTDADHLAEVRALARLAAGRAEAEVLPLVPDGASETSLIVRGAILWQDLDAPVPGGLVAGLQGIQPRSGLGESVLALALLRAGDEMGASAAAERLLLAASDQIVARVLRATLRGDGEAPIADDAESGESGETGGESGDTGETGEDEGGIAKPPPPPDEDGGGSGGGGGGGGGNRLERLIERGCEQVSSGNAGGGIQTLLKAFDINPKDLDVLVCLADGYAAQGTNKHALDFYNRALQQSPTHRGALRGAAKLAAKTGATERAIELYERLLRVDSNNAAAKAFLAKHKPDEAQPSEPKPSPEPEPPAAETTG